MEIGFVFALTFVIAAVQVNLSTGSGITINIQPQETVDLNQIQRTQHESEPPQRPPVPRAVPNNTPITKDRTFDASLKVDDELQDHGPPSPPNQSPGKQDDDPFVRVQQMPKLIGGLMALQEAVEYPE